MNKKKIVIQGQYQIEKNVEYVLKDKYGNVRKLFTENKLGTALLRFFRKLVSSPIDEQGQVKPGFFNYLAAYGLRLQFVTGYWGNSRLVKNLITNAGLAGVASRIGGAGAEAAFTYIVLGTGTTAAAVTDTTLVAEITTGGGARANATVSRITTTVTNDTSQLQYTFTFTSSFTITESGVLNATSAGVLLCRQVFSAINVVSTDQLQITWKIKAS